MRKELFSPALFLAAAAVLITAAALLASRERASGRPALRPMEPLRIAVAADLHYLSPALTDGGSYFTQVITNADGKLMQYSDALTEAFADEIIRTQPDVLILPGDLTFNGARESHTALIEKLRRISDAGVRVLVMPGNHDLENSMAAAFHGDSFTRVDSITQAEFAALYAPFGYGDALSRDEASLSYVSEISPGLRLLFLDTNLPEAPGELREATLRWAEEALQAAQEAGARVICVTHQTALQHNSVFTDGFTIRGADALTVLLQRYDVRCTFCGHMHIQHLRTLGSLTEIAVSSLAVWPCQYGILDVNADGGSFSTAAVDVPDVSGFAEHAQAFFDANTLRQGSAAVSDAGDRDAMLEYLAQMNRGYYSGRMDAVRVDPTLQQAWEAADPFIAAYLRSLTEDAGQDFTQTTFTF